MCAVLLRDLSTNLSGRRIKKKCDEQKPVCGICQRRGRQTCEWPESSAEPPPSQTTPPSGAAAQCHARISTGAVTASCDFNHGTKHESGVVGKYGATNAYLGPSLLTSMQPSVCAVLSQSDSVKWLSESQKWELLRQANRAIHGAYIDDYYSILVPAFPALIESSSYTNAWLALGAVLLAKHLPPDSQLAQVAIHCHTKAIHGLLEHLRVSKVPSQWAVSTLVLLHIFERYGDTYQPPSDAHAKSIRTVFLQRYNDHPPSNTTQLLQLSSLIYRVAVINMFRPLSSDDPADYHCLDKHVDAWSSSRASTGLWQHSLWIGLTPEVFNFMFKLSTLVRLAPLTEPWLSKLDQLESEMADCDVYPALSSLAEWKDDDRERLLSLAAQSDIAHGLYYCAFRILVIKIRALASGHLDDGAQQLTYHGIQTLHKLIEANFVSMTLLWPALIISLDARKVEEQSISTSFLSRLENSGGPRSIASVRRLLGVAWQLHDGNMLGTDVLFQQELAANVFL